MSSKRFCNEDSFSVSTPTTASSDDTFDIQDVYSPSSLDRSSVGSLPWAEDAIKQNQLEWERIERMFYGEDDLPAESELRNEILEWRKAFPQLRVKGKKVEVPSNSRENCFNVKNPQKEKIPYSPEGQHIKMEESTSGQAQGSRENRNSYIRKVENIRSSFENLRFGSFNLHKPHQQASTNKIPTRGKVVKVGLESPVQRVSTIKQYRTVPHSKSSGAILPVLTTDSGLGSLPKLSSSASFYRIPPVPTDRGCVIQVDYLAHPPSQRVKSTTKRLPHLPQPVILPAITLAFKLGDLHPNSRSISAAVGRREPKSLSVFSASKLQKMQ